MRKTILVRLCAVHFGWLAALAFVIATSFAALPEARAHTSTQFFRTKITDVANQGSVSKVSGKVVVFNVLPEPLQVKLVYAVKYDAGQRYPSSKAVESSTVTVKPGAEASLPFSFQLSQDGKYQVVMSLPVLDKKGFELGSQHVDLYFKVKAGKYERGTYDSVYSMPESVAPQDAPAGGFSTAAADPNEAVVPLPASITRRLGVNRLPHKALPAPRGSDGAGPGAPSVPSTPGAPHVPTVAPPPGAAPVPTGTVNH